MRTLIYFILLYATLPECYARPVKSFPEVSSITIKTPDSTVKANITTRKSKSLPKQGCFYYWYSANNVCSTDGGYAGRLLHGQYSSFYPNNNLLAQGEFRLGLKDGCWKRWFADGKIHEIANFRNGKLSGSFEIYSPSGQLLMRIYFKDGVRAGKTKIFSQGKPDSVIHYKNGRVVEKKHRPKTNRTDSVVDSSGASFPKPKLLSILRRDSVKSDTSNKKAGHRFRKKKTGSDSTGVPAVVKQKMP